MTVTARESLYKVKKKLCILRNNVETQALEYTVQVATERLQTFKNIVSFVVCSHSVCPSRSQYLHHPNDVIVISNFLGQI